MTVSFSRMLRDLLPLTPYNFSGKYVCCPVCNSEKSEVIGKLDRRLKKLTTSLCNDCGLFYTNPMPTAQELEEYYKNQYRADYQFAFTKPKNIHIQRKTKEAQLRYESFKPYISAKQIQFLDFGCGSGELVKKFAEEGHHARGLEPGESYSTFLSSTGQNDGSFHIDNGDWQTISYQEKTYDMISALHVLEHLSDPVSALQKIHSWLKDDGVAIIEVPDMQAYSLKGFEHFHFAHVVGFSRDNFIRAADKAGFSVIKEMAPTSLVLRKKKDGAAMNSKIDLAKTYQTNRDEYGAKTSPITYVKYHIKRNFKRMTDKN